MAFDSDVHRLLAYSGAAAPSVIRDNWTHAELAGLIEQVMPAHDAALRKRVLLSVTRRQVRIAAASHPPVWSPFQTRNNHQRPHAMCCVSIAIMIDSPVMPVANNISTAVATLRPCD